MNGKFFAVFRLPMLIETDAAKIAAASKTQ